jgi:hypothetical protein
VILEVPGANTAVAATAAEEDSQVRRETFIDDNLQRLSGMIFPCRIIAVDNLEEKNTTYIEVPSQADGSTRLDWQLTMLFHEPVF